MTRTKKAIAGGSIINSVGKMVGFNGKSPKTLEEETPKNKLLFDLLNDYFVKDDTEQPKKFCFVGGKNIGNFIEPIEAVFEGGKINIDNIANIAFLKLKYNLLRSRLGTANLSKLGVYLKLKKQDSNEYCIIDLNSFVEGNYNSPIKKLALSDLPAENKLNRDHIKMYNEGKRITSYTKVEPNFIYVIGLPESKNLSSSPNQRNLFGQILMRSNPIRIS
jgi:hypothetical protein